MFNLQNRISGIDEDKKYLGTRMAIRDKLLSQEFKELEKNLRDVISCKLFGTIHEWCFKFSINVPPEYNNVPPVVKCLTRVWHPNISEDGNICLSILRQNSLMVMVGCQLAV
uniref:UBC core domain-containing protein n=1 Tax=Ditylenchus dipsaci TaxID=166011 RepID=A0A915EPL5_9BILA